MIAMLPMLPPAPPVALIVLLPLAPRVPSVELEERHALEVRNRFERRRAETMPAPQRRRAA